MEKLEYKLKKSEFPHRGGLTVVRHSPTPTPPQDTCFPYQYALVQNSRTTGNTSQESHPIPSPYTRPIPLTAPTPHFPIKIPNLYHQKCTVQSTGLRIPEHTSTRWAIKLGLEPWATLPDCPYSKPSTRGRPFHHSLDPFLRPTP